MSPPFQAKPTWATERVPEAAPKQMCVLGEIISSSCVQYCFIAHTKTNEKQLRATQQSQCEKVHLPPVPYTSSVSERVHDAAEHQAEQTAETERGDREGRGKKKKKENHTFIGRNSRCWRSRFFHRIYFPSIHPSVFNQRLSCTQACRGAGERPGYRGWWMKGGYKGGAAPWNENQQLVAGATLREPARTLDVP